MATILDEEVEAHGPDFERLARTPWPIASLASSGIKLLSSVLACSCSRWAERVRAKMPANSAQALELLSGLPGCAVSVARPRIGEGARRFRRDARISAPR